MSLRNRTRTACKHLRLTSSSLYLLFSLTQWGQSDQLLVLEWNMKRYKSNFCFQLEHKAAASRWDQFRTSASLLARPHCVKDRRGGKHWGMCCFSPGFNSFFVVPLSCSTSGVFLNLPVVAPRSGRAMGRQCKSCPGRHDNKFTCHAILKKENKRMKLAFITTTSGSCVCVDAITPHFTKHSTKA